MKSIDSALMDLKEFEPGLRAVLEPEMVELKKDNPDVQAILNPWGFAAYFLGDSGIRLTTIHNGSYVPEEVELIQTPEERAVEEDLFTGELYKPIFLEHGGVWVNNHLSRYVADMNRPWEKAIFSYGSDGEISNLIEDKGKKRIVRSAEDAYVFFYQFARESFEFVSDDSFIFNGHSMGSIGDKKGRGNFCLVYDKDVEGIGLKSALEEQRFKNVKINNPFKYGGGHFRVHFDNGRSVEFETNKRLYMDETTFNKKRTFTNVSKRIAAAVTAYLRQ